MRSEYWSAAVAILWRCESCTAVKLLATSSVATLSSTLASFLSFMYYMLAMEKALRKPLTEGIRGCYVILREYKPSGSEGPEAAP